MKEKNNYKGIAMLYSVSGEAFTKFLSFIYLFLYTVFCFCLALLLLELKGCRGARGGVKVQLHWHVTTAGSKAN